MKKKIEKLINGLQISAGVTILSVFGLVAYFSRLWAKELEEIAAIPFTDTAFWMFFCLGILLIVSAATGLWLIANGIPPIKRRIENL